MLLSKETTVKLNRAHANIVGHMCYAAYKLWNECNYERRTWNKDDGAPYPGWYKQKASHKDSTWFKSLPSQSAQEVCKTLDGAWKSFYRLKETGGVTNPSPPGYKHEPMSFTYMQNGMKRVSSAKLRLAVPKKLREHMQSRYGIRENYIYLENDIFKGMDNIKQVHVYPPREDGTMRVIAVYEVPDFGFVPDNGHYLSIDLGVHNLMTCVDSLGCDSFIVGRKYLSITRNFDRKIAEIQSIWYTQQVKKGVKHPKPSKHILKLYEDKRNAVNDYLHKATHYIASYCTVHHVCTVIIGDLTGIRNGKDLGDKTNQKLHALPYKKLTDMLRYKLALRGIRLCVISEAYSSKCSPLSPSVSKKYADGSNRVKRGLYCDGGHCWNADSVGAFNILRKYLVSRGDIHLPVSGLAAPKVIEVAV